MAIYTFDFSEEENWVLNDANISGGTLNISAVQGYGQRSPDANWLSGANDDFEIEFDFRITASSEELRITLWLEGDATPISFLGRATFDYMRIYYGSTKATQGIDIVPTTWYTAKIRRVGTIFYFSINGGDEISWDYGTARALEYMRLRLTIGTSGTFDNFIYRWLEEEEEIVKTFQDSGVGADSLLVNKTLIFPDSGIGVDKWVLPATTYIVFSDSGSGADAIKVDKTLVFSDAGSGIDIFKIDKTVIFSDLGEGVDIFLIDKEAIFKDVATAIDKFRASYPYPKDLKRKIIIIRDIK